MVVVDVEDEKQRHSRRWDLCGCFKRAGLSTGTQIVIMMLNPRALIQK